MRRLIALGIAVAVAIVAIAFVATAAESKSGRTVKTRTTSLGKILVDGKGRTLYLWVADTKGKSTCTGQCATAWPPLLTGAKPKAAGGAKQAKLGTVKRAGGKLQVTYNGHPLYTFIADANKPGNVKGEGSKGFGAAWWVVNAKGKAIKKAAASVTPTPVPTGPTY
jgi:predicted lipoprotein with Yx(FWY)xxD motif